MFSNKKFPPEKPGKEKAPASKRYTAESIAADIKAGKIKNIVVLTGAGLSTSAGIPDFRSPGSGLYTQMSKYKLPYPEAVFSLDYFLKNPEAFYTIAKGMQGTYFPTKAHYFLRLLQDKGLLLKNFTQNIDNLEVDAGMRPELLVQAHGKISSSHCAKCHKEVDQKLMMEHISAGTPLFCSACKSPCKPDIVMFGESLPFEFHTVLGSISQADLMIVIGTSLKVLPVSALIDMVKPGTPRLIIDKVVPDTIATAGYQGDAVMLGGADEMAEKLVAMLGWDGEFAGLMKEREERIAKFKPAADVKK